MISQQPVRRFHGVASGPLQPPGGFCFDTQPLGSQCVEGFSPKKIGRFLSESVWASPRLSEIPVYFGFKDEFDVSFPVGFSAENLTLRPEKTEKFNLEKCHSNGFFWQSNIAMGKHFLMGKLAIPSGKPIELWKITMFNGTTRYK